MSEGFSWSKATLKMFAGKQGCMLVEGCREVKKKEGIMNGKVRIAVERRCECGGKNIGKVMCPVCEGKGEEDEGCPGDYDLGECRRCLGEKKVDGECGKCGGSGWIGDFITGREMLEILGCGKVESRQKRRVKGV